MTAISNANMRLSDCARLLSARLHVGLNTNLQTQAISPNTSTGEAFHGVSSDSRTIGEGEMFVALKGEHFDGHDYVSNVAARGAAAALVSRVVDVAIPQIVVGDTMWAYGQLAQYWRSRFTIPTIALTGSNGKTTVKEMLRAILIAHTNDSTQVLATEGNLNNNIGVPQMLLRLHEQHRYAVFEMGMNHLNEIDYLTRLVVPDVALINMAGTAHIGELGSREAIAQAKGEIYAGLRDDGVACINLDDAFAAYWQGRVGKRRVVTFGLHRDAFVRGTLINDGVTITTDGDQVAIALQVTGEHNQRNAIAAAAGAYVMNIPLAAIQHGLEQFQGVDGRLKTWRGHNTATIIDDTYNANPDSMRAAIAVLAAKKGKRLLVLGDMGELGVNAKQMHHEIGVDARNANIDGVFALGALATEYVNAFGTNNENDSNAKHFASFDALVVAVVAQLDADTTVLVKGSRFMKMERVVEKLAVDYTTNRATTHATKQQGHH